MTYVKLIHKSDVYFDIQRTKNDDEKIADEIKENMQRGEVYIYQDFLFLFDGINWYKARISNIKDITSSTPHKKIHIRFKDFYLVLFSNQFSHLLALRDFLYLSHRTPNIETNIILPETGGLGGYK